jgi:hypothetical protein
MFIPPINLGGWKPSPATMSEWIYQIWKYLQDNPIATQEQIKEFINEQIGDDIAEKLPEVLPEELAAYFEEHPIDFPVDSVNGKLGTVLLELADIVQSDSMLPVVSLANDEADQETLVESFEAGARICVIDEESVSVMLPTYAQDGGVSAVTLLPMSTSGEGGDFSPITLSIGSSGNKTLNAGGTVAFTLAEIGAASASDLTTLGVTVSQLSTTVGGLSTDMADVKTDITALQSKAPVVVDVGDTIYLASGVRVFGNLSNGSSAAFTLCLPIKIGEDVTGFTITNASANTKIYQYSGTAVVTGGFAPNTTKYIEGNIASRESGILSVIAHYPQATINTGMCYLFLAGEAQSGGTTITFTGS